MTRCSIGLSLVAAMALAPGAALAQAAPTGSSDQSDVVVMRRVLAEPRRGAGTPTPTPTPTPMPDGGQAYGWFLSCDGAATHYDCLSFDGDAITGSSDVSSCNVAQDSALAAEVARVSAAYASYGISFSPAGPRPPALSCAASTGPFAYGYRCDNAGQFTCAVIDESGINPVASVDPTACRAPEADSSGDQAVADAGYVPVGSGVDQSYACEATRQVYGRRDVCSFRDTGGGIATMYLLQTCFDLSSTPIAATDMDFCDHARPPTAADRELASSLGVSSPDVPATITCTNPSGSVIRRTVTGDVSTSTSRRVDFTFTCVGADGSPAAVSTCSDQIQAWDDASRASAGQQGLDYTSGIDLSAGTRYEIYTVKP